MDNENKKRKSAPSVEKDKADVPLAEVEGTLFHAQSKFLSSLKLPNINQHTTSTSNNSNNMIVQNYFFSEDHITPEYRGELWSNQADYGESLINKYAWATPDERAMKIIQHNFAGGGEEQEEEGREEQEPKIVEIGCGANAYWAQMMHSRGIDVLAFDSELDNGGQIQNSSSSSPLLKKEQEQEGTKIVGEGGLTIQCGGPEVLSSEEWKRKGDIDKRTLFLCYPDEETSETTATIGNDNDDDNNNNTHQTMASACLEHFQGDVIIHVGELYGDTISMDQAPWGRSSGPEFQQRLAAEFHCILKAKLQNWLHVRDSISVWKRTKCCSMVFQGDDEDEDDEDEEVSYKFIPPEEVLPTDIAAPCVEHLLAVD